MLRTLHVSYVSRNHRTQRHPSWPVQAPPPAHLSVLQADSTLGVATENQGRHPAPPGVLHTIPQAGIRIKLVRPRRTAFFMEPTLPQFREALSLFYSTHMGGVRSTPSVSRLTGLSWCRLHPLLTAQLPRLLQDKPSTTSKTSGISLAFGGQLPTMTLYVRQGCTTHAEVVLRTPRLYLQHHPAYGPCKG